MLLCLIEFRASAPLILRTFSLSLSHFYCLKITYYTSYTQLHYSSSYLCLCDQKHFVSFSIHHPYYPHQPRVPRHTYLVNLTTVPNMSSYLPLGKYKFDTWFSPSEVLYDSSMHLRNHLSCIHTYEPSTLHTRVSGLAQTSGFHFIVSISCTHHSAFLSTGSFLCGGYGPY